MQPIIAEGAYKGERRTETPIALKDIVDPTRPLQSRLKIGQGLIGDLDLKRMDFRQTCSVSISANIERRESLISSRTQPHPVFGCRTSPLPNPNYTPPPHPSHPPPVALLH